MKHFLAGCALLTNLMMFGQSAPGSVYPTPQIHLGWSLSDYAMQTFGLEGTYRFNRHAVIIGYGSVSGNYNTGSEDEDREYQNLSGNTFKLNHKLYISGQDQLYFSLVHGPILQYYALPYFVKDWVSFQEDGLTLYRLGDVEKTYVANRWGYDFRINLEYVAYFFSADFGFGLGYRALMSDNQIPEGYSLDGQFNGIAYQGIRPSFQLKLGFYLDAFNH